MILYPRNDFGIVVLLLVVKGYTTLDLIQTAVLVSYLLDFEVDVSKGSVISFL